MPTTFTPIHWYCCCCCCKVASVVSNSVRPHRRQPTRLRHPWDSAGKNTGVGCHFLLQCMKVKSESEVAQSCPTPSDPMDYSLPAFSIHGICQARVQEWVAIAFSDQKIARGYISLWSCLIFTKIHRFMLEFYLFLLFVSTCFYTHTHSQPHT